MHSVSSSDDTAERTETRRPSDDGTRIVIVTRWLDRQMSPPKWRSKNRSVKLKPNEVEYYRLHVEQTT